MVVASHSNKYTSKNASIGTNKCDCNLIVPSIKIAKLKLCFRSWACLTTDTAASAGAGGHMRYIRHLAQHVRGSSTHLFYFLIKSPYWPLFTVLFSTTFAYSILFNLIHIHQSACWWYSLTPSWFHMIPVINHHEHDQPTMADTFCGSAPLRSAHPPWRKLHLEARKATLGSSCRRWSMVVASHKFFTSS